MLTEKPDFSLLFKSSDNTESSYSGSYFLIQWKPSIPRREVYNIGVLFLDDDNQIKNCYLSKEHDSLFSYLVEKIKKEEERFNKEIRNEVEIKEGLLFQLELLISVTETYIQHHDLNENFFENNQTPFSQNLIFSESGFAQGKSVEEIMSNLSELV